MFDVYGDKDGFVAVGWRADQTDRDHPAIWQSVDGATWIDVSPSAAGTLEKVVRQPGGVYVAAGVDENDSFAVWRSEDRTHWARVAISAPAFRPGAFLTIGLASSTDSLILVAETATGWKSWTSRDGQTWANLAVTDADPRPSRGTVIAAHEDRVVLFAGETNELWVGRLTPIQ